MPQFYKGGPCWEQQEGKLLTNICAQLYMLHTILWCFFLLKHLSLGELWGCEPFSGQKVLRSASNGRGAFYAPPRPTLSLQTPASDEPVICGFFPFGSSSLSGSGFLFAWSVYSSPLPASSWYPAPPSMSTLYNTIFDCRALLKSIWNNPQMRNLYRWWCLL